MKEALTTLARVPITVYTLDYCNSLTADGSNHLLHRMQVMQDAGTRFIAGARRTEHVTLVLHDCTCYQFGKEFFVNRVINVWNNLPQDTDFSSFNLFRYAIENMDLSQYLKYDK